MKWPLLIATLAAGFIILSCRNNRSADRTSRVSAAEKKPVTDYYHGIAVIDDYRWLEDANDPAVRAFVAQQNKHSRAYFDNLPIRSAILARLKELHQRSAAYYGLVQRGHAIFALKDQPPKNHPSLITLNAQADPASERILFDPDQFDRSSQTAIDWYVPSLDGKLVAISLSEKGSEDGSLHVFAAETGNKLPDVVPRVQFPTAGGSAAWSRDGSGFYYTRFPQGEERPPEDRNFYQQIYYHRLGTPASQDRYVLGKEFPRIAEIELQSNHDGRFLLASVANGDGGEFAHYLMNPRGRWTQITRFADKVVAAVMGKDDQLYLLSHMDADRGKILVVPMAAPVLAKAKILVPAGQPIIDQIHVTKDRLYIVDLVGGPQQVRLFDLKGNALGTLPIEPVSAVRGFLALDDGSVLYNHTSYIAPPAWHRYDPQTGQSVKTALSV
ncbi:MAG TPA: S9 family peptidase, partial [bacterium]|nr:S9 family peptidase [bacterium]